MIVTDICETTTVLIMLSHHAAGGEYSAYGMRSTYIKDNAFRLIANSADNELECAGC